MLRNWLSDSESRVQYLLAPNNSFKVLNLRNANITDDDIREVLLRYTIFVHNPQIEVLDLSCNRITAKSLPVISQMFLKVDPGRRSVIVCQTRINFAETDMSFCDACVMVNSGQRISPVYIASKEDTAQMILDNTNRIADAEVAIHRIRTDVAELKSDVADLKSDVHARLDRIEALLVAHIKVAK